MTDVLSGVRVLEVAEQGFVPSAAAVLADWGADVVKVERPEGDGLRAVMKQGLVAQAGDFDFLVEQVNRNKRNVCLDLKHGRNLQLNMLSTDKYWQAACEALEAPELAADPSLQSDVGRAPRLAEIRERFARNVASKPLAHWAERLRAAGCIFSFFATPSEVQGDPQVLANGYLPRHPTHPKARLAASPVQFDEEPILVRRAAPGKGEHTAEVLDALGIDARERSRLRQAGAIA